MPARRLEGGYNGCALNCSIIKVVTPLQLRHLALRIVVWSEPTATRRKRRNTSNAHSTMSFIPQSLKPRRFSSGAQIAVRIVFSGSYTNFTDSCSARQFPYHVFSRIYSDRPIWWHYRSADSQLQLYWFILVPIRNRVMTRQVFTCSSLVIALGHRQA